MPPQTTESSWNSKLASWSAGRVYNVIISDPCWHEWELVATIAQLLFSSERLQYCPEVPGGLVEFEARVPRYSRVLCQYISLFFKNWLTDRHMSPPCGISGWWNPLCNLFWSYLIYSGLISADLTITGKCHFLPKLLFLDQTMWKN